MIQIIAGEKGKGKTKYLLELANKAIKSANGNIVYLDKSKKHMYELNNKIRLIDVTEFKLLNCDEFVGFLAGILSQDHDLEEMYFDSFLTISALEDEQISQIIDRLDFISEKYHVKFVLSISKKKEEMPDGLKDKVIASL